MSWRASARSSSQRRCSKTTRQARRWAVSMLDATTRRRRRRRHRRRHSRRHHRCHRRHRPPRHHHRRHRQSRISHHHRHHLREAGVGTSPLHRARAATMYVLRTSSPATARRSHSRARTEAITKNSRMPPWPLGSRATLLIASMATLALSSTAAVTAFRPKIRPTSSVRARAAPTNGSARALRRLGISVRAMKTCRRRLLLRCSPRLALDSVFPPVSIARAPKRRASQCGSGACSRRFWER